MPHRPSNNQSSFAPWNKNYKAANVLWLFSAAWLAGGLIWLFWDASWPPLVVVLLGAFTLHLSLSADRRGLKRQNGVEKEKLAVERLHSAIPEQWKIRSDTYIKSVGNIDLIVMLANGQSCVIEIKHLSRILDGLLRKAIRQVRRQSRIINADHRFVWFPESKNYTHKYRQGVHLVFGDESYLLERLVSADAAKFKVTFPTKPNPDVLELLRGVRKKSGNKFYYNKSKQCWEGMAPAFEMEIIKADIQDNGGIILSS